MSLYYSETVCVKICFYFKNELTAYKYSEILDWKHEIYGVLGCDTV